MKLDYSYLVQGRTALMGFCIIWIYLFHITTKSVFLDSFSQIGWCGVDCFFLLSGIGLSHSLERDKNVVGFYKRRAFRILPTWWFLIFSFHIINLFANRPCPGTFLQVLLYYSGIGWFFNGFFQTERIAWSEWYVPTLLLFYIVSPLIHRMSIRSLIKTIIILFIINIVLSLFHLCDSLRLSYFRVPSFLLGFLIFKIILKYKVNNSKCVSFNIAILINLFLFVCGYLCLFLFSDLSATTKHPATFFEAIGAVFISLGVLQLVSCLSKVKKINTLLSAFGKVSLELYLLHVFFISIAWRLRTELPIPDTASILIALFIYLIMSIIVSKFVKHIVNFCKNKCCTILN